MSDDYHDPPTSEAQAAFKALVDGIELSVVKHPGDGDIYAEWRYRRRCVILMVAPWGEPFLTPIEITIRGEVLQPIKYANPATTENLREALDWMKQG